MSLVWSYSARRHDIDDDGGGDGDDDGDGKLSWFSLHLPHLMVGRRFSLQWRSSAWSPGLTRLRIG